MSLTKVTFSMIDGAYIDATNYGVDITGVTDSSMALQLALNACTNGQILYVRGNIKLDSQVVAPSTLGGIVGDGMGVTTITYTKEQPTPSPVYDGSQCAIVLTGINKARFEDFTLVYTGTFDEPGSPYFGVVSGLYIKNCNDIIVRRVEATGFNCTGVQFTSSAPTLSERNVIEESYLHHNRQSGCYCDRQKFFTIRNCKLEYNGQPGEGATGYGFSANTNGYSENILVTENQTFNNYRKGIDFHDGKNIVCTDNICINDAIHGIFYENTETPPGSIIIANNYVQCDPDYFYSAPYNFYKGISVSLAYNDTLTSPNVSIIGNVLENIYKTNSDETLPIYVQNLTGDRVLVNVSKNTVRGGAAWFGILVESSIHADEVTSNIEGNAISMGALTYYGIGVTPSDPLSAGNAGYSQIVNNNIIAISCGGPLVSVKTGLKTVDISDNTATVNTLAHEAVKVESTAGSQVRIKNNSVNASVVSSVSKFVFNSQKVIYANKNTVNGVEQGSAEKISPDTGSRRVWRSTKTLTSGVLTDVIRFAKEYTQGYYKVKWSAWYDSGTLPTLYTSVAGGEFVFVAGWSNTAQIASSAITPIATTAANNGSANISLSWGIYVDLSLTDLYARVLQVTSNVNCTLYYEMEAILSLDKVPETTLPVL